MFLTVKRLMALSLPTHREQFEQRTNLTWPRPFLLRPLFLRFLVYTRGFQHAGREVHPNIQVAIQPLPAQFEGSFAAGQHNGPLKGQNGAHHLESSSGWS